jgi:uncharacterized protein (TIGR03067 family)
MKCQFCCLILVFLCTGPFARCDGTWENDDKLIQGGWKPVTAELGGKPFPEEVLKTMKLILSDGKYTVLVGEQKDEGTVKLDPAQKPSAMDIVGTKGPNQGKTIPAIYELSHNKLRICYDLSGKERPKKFETRPDTQLFLVEYQLQQP